MPPCNVMHRSHHWSGGGVIEKLKSKACGLERVQSDSCHKGKGWVGGSASKSKGRTECPKMLSFLRIYTGPALLTLTSGNENVVSSMRVWSRKVQCNQIPVLLWVDEMDVRKLWTSGGYCGWADTRWWTEKGKCTARSPFHALHYCYAVHESLNRRGCNIVTVSSDAVGNRKEIGRKWKLTIWG